MAHIDNPREEFTKTGVGLPLLIIFLYYIINIAMVVFAVLAFFSFRTDFNRQQELMFSVVKGEESALSKATYEDGKGRYRVDYDKLGEDYQRYFDSDRLKDKKSDGKQTEQEFMVSVLEDKDTYSPVSTKTTVFGIISAGLLVLLVARSLRQIRAVY